MSQPERIESLDYLRLAAASAVMFSHAYVLSGAPCYDWLMTYTGRMDLAALAVDFFFFLSGFLMFGALARSQDRVRFVRNRLARIMPGLTVCVLLCIGLGSIYSTLPLENYLRSSQTWRYLTNAVFLFNPSLPGVFESTPYPNVVNGSLWTLFYEIACYAVVAAAAALRPILRLRLFQMMALLSAFFLSLDGTAGPTFASNMARLMCFFALGHMFAAPRGIVHVSSVLGVMTLASLLLGSEAWPRLEWHLVAALACAGVLGVARLLDRFVHGLPADYSFGIYIYGFPVQQWLAAHSSSLNPWEFFISSLVLVIPLAALSWHLVERPSMQLIQRRILQLGKEKYASVR